VQHQHNQLLSCVSRISEWVFFRIPLFWGGLDIPVAVRWVNYLVIWGLKWHFSSPLFQTEYHHALPEINYFWEGVLREELYSYG
jgi:hypothetical protein